MKRDIDLIRKILFQIEKNDMGVGKGIDVNIPGVDEHVLSDHVLQLYEAGYIDAIDVSSAQGKAHIPIRITWPGHDFLDSIRDENIWKKTCERIAKISGSASVDIVKALAISFAHQQVGLSS